MPFVMDKHPLEPFVHLVAVHNQKPEKYLRFNDGLLWSLDLPLSMVARAVQDEAETGIMNKDLVLVVHTES